jgi:hypothetical protein
MIMASCCFEGGGNSTKRVLISTTLRRLARLTVAVDRAIENVHTWGLRG